MNARPYLLLSGTIFALVAGMHLYRAALALPFQLGAIFFPVGVSWAGGVAAAALSVWAFRLAARRG